MSAVPATPQLNAGALPSQYQKFVSDIEAAAAKWNVDPTVLAGLLVHESGIDANGNPKVSPAGAVGIAQFMLPTAAGYGVNPYDAKQSIDGAAHYLSDNLKATGNNYTDALAMYNEGGPQYDKYGVNGPPNNIYETPLKYAQTILDYAKQLAGGSAPGVPLPGPTPDPQAGPPPTTSQTTTTQTGGFWIGPWKVGFPTGPGGVPLSQYFIALLAGGILIIGGIAWLMKSEAEAHPEIAKVATEAAIA